VSSCIVKAFEDAGISCEVVADLCGMAADKDARMKEWAQAENLTVIACYERAVRWLFDRADSPLNDDNVQFYNARTGDVDEIVASVTAANADDSSGEINRIGQKGQWIPWYPVIDYDRCTNCKQCLNFCLFGVYALSDDGKVQVAKPDGCKTNCPACARVCPERAIIFPKYGDSPINGDEVDENAIDRDKDRSEVEALLGGDIHEIIRKRKARKLFARAEEGDEKLSAQQKLSRLSRLQKELDIPQEVLDSLLKQQASAGGGDCPDADLCPGDCPNKGGAKAK
jgi:NAD-dependent dihydropyrimidine dehydrogenase PreA subunit